MTEDPRMTLCIASARTGRCPRCRAKILVPYEYCDGDADDIGGAWVRAGKRIIDAHTDVAHPDRPVPWTRLTDMPREVTR